MKKQILALLIVSLLVMTFSICFAASKFPDTVNTKYDTAVEKLSSKNVISGFPDGTFKPGDPVTRAQMAKMIVEGLGLKKTTDLPMLKFSDINLTDKTHWGYEWIKVAVENNIIVGYPDGTFGPDREVTFAECETMILRAMKLESGMSDKTWPTGYMNEATKQGLLNDVAYSDPNAAANRGEIAISLYNMVMKVEKQKAEEELAKLEAEKKAEQEAKENALEFGIVSSTSYSKDVYYLKFYDDKTKYEIYSIGGKTKLTDSKVEDLKDNVIGYKEGKNGLEANVTYTPSSFDSALLITKIDGNTATFKDKTYWDTTNSTLKEKYQYYTFIRINASADDDGIISFDKVTKLGLGLSSVKLAKSERVLIDTTNKIVAVLKGIDSSATIKKGKISDSSSDTSDYLYGWVKSTRTKSSTQYVTIEKKEYEAKTKGTFDEDTFAVYTLYKEGTDYDIIKYVKSYGVANLDSDAQIVSSVSSGTKVTYKGGSTVDYSTSTNLKKYEDYEIVEVTVEKDSNNLAVKDYDTGVDLEDITFKAGDRVIIDSKYEVFVVFHGLSTSDSYKNGSKYVATTYKLTYTWKEGSDLGTTLGLTKPEDKTGIESGTSVKLWNPTVSDEYTLTLKKGSTTLTKGQSLTITTNTTIDIYLEKNKTPLEKAYDEMQAALTAWNNAKEDEADKLSKMNKASGDVETAQGAYDEADGEYQAAKSAFENNTDPDQETALAQTMSEKLAIKNEKEKALNTATTAFNSAKTAYINAQKTTANKEAAYEAAKAKWIALAEA